MATIDEYYNHDITDEWLKSLPARALVNVVWSGGNRGEYRVYKDQFGYSFADQIEWYNSDGTDAPGYEWVTPEMRRYNRLSRMNVWDVKIISDEKA